MPPAPICTISLPVVSGPSHTRDYGYRRKVVAPSSPKIPMSFFEFCKVNVTKEFRQKRYGFSSDPYASAVDRSDAYRIMRLRRSLKQLKLDDGNIWKREQEREMIESPRLLMSIYYIICHLLDVIYADKPIDRFWFLETIARMPYFSYVAILHMYETLGWWELDSELKRVHHNEELNETYHLKIMESLGGDIKWWNRFLARHVAMFYYAMLMGFFLVSPRTAYLSSELLERHAVDTYVEFYESNERILRDLPLTEAAAEYSEAVNNLYYVFVMIANDEFKHAESMEYIRKLPDK